MIRRVASIPGPTVSAVTLADIKDHLRVAHDDDDARILDIGLEATAFVEKWTQRILSPRNAALRLSDVPPGATPIWLPGGIVNSLASFTVDGNAVSGIEIVGDSPALLVPAAEWPVPTGEGFPVVVTYNVGYSAVPGPLQSAIKLYASWSFDGTDTMAAMEANMMRYRIRPI